MNSQVRINQEKSEYIMLKGLRTCHGFEAATGSSIFNECMKRRIEWMQNVYKVKIQNV